MEVVEFDYNLPKKTKYGYCFQKVSKGKIPNFIGTGYNKVSQVKCSNLGYYFLFSDTE